MRLAGIGLEVKGGSSIVTDKGQGKRNANDFQRGVGLRTKSTMRCARPRFHVKQGWLANGRLSR